MLLKDIYGMHDYLKNDCYCPGEIYDPNGFFFLIFKDEDECSKIAENAGTIAVICKNQILYIFKDDTNKIEDVVRVDATENNIGIIKALIAGKEPKGRIDEFKKGFTQRSLQELMSIADAVIID